MLLPLPPFSLVLLQVPVISINSFIHVHLPPWYSVQEWPSMREEATMSLKRHRTNLPRHAHHLNRSPPSSHAAGKRRRRVDTSSSGDGDSGAEGEDELPSVGREWVNALDLIAVSRRLHDQLKDKAWKGTSKHPVACSYNVFEYATAPHEDYTNKFGGGRPIGRAFMVGMNPGPWGMVQTGVPFGEVSFVRDWLKIRGAVGRPRQEHAKRPVDGFSCQRSEVSGKRLWGFFERKFGSADAWGDKMFAYNYCPLTFMNASGGNITPDRLPPKEREAIEDVCDQALVDMVSALRPCVVVGVGNFAGSKCLKAVEATGFEVDVVVVNHPSPASPSGVRWERATCMDELVLSSSVKKDIDRFLV